MTRRSGAGLLALAMGATAALTVSLAALPALAADLVGQPTPGGIGLQPAAAPLKVDAIFFHDVVLLPIIVGICLLVLGLLAYVMIRFNKKANPVPARWSHNTTVEIIWTVLPVVILAVIAIFSFRLLYKYHDMPKPDVTVKVTGNQWYWSYEYPELGDYAFDSHQLPEAEAKAKGVPFRLAADNPMVVPVGKTVRLIITGADVIHAVALPAFGLKTDAIPGRINETWFKADKVGVYYGQCSELCGVDHAFMPLQINVVSEADYAAWAAPHKPAPVAAPAAETAPADANAAETAPADTANAAAPAAPAAPAA